jgi:hypothetical protein
MTHRHDDPPAPQRERRRPVDPELEDKSFFQLIPRRDLTKVVMLVVMLVVVVALQRRSGGLIRSLTRGLTAPPAAQTLPRQDPPKVRLAPRP